MSKPVASVLISSSVVTFDRVLGIYVIGSVANSVFWLVDQKYQYISCPKVGESYFVHVYNPILQDIVKKDQYLLSLGNNTFRGVFAELSKSTYTVSSIINPNSISGVLTTNGLVENMTWSFRSPNLPIKNDKFTLGAANWNCIACPCVEGYCEGPESVQCQNLCAGSTAGACPAGYSCVYSNGQYSCLNSQICLDQPCGGNNGKCPGFCPADRPVCLVVDGFYNCLPYDPCGQCSSDQVCIVEGSISKCVNKDPCNGQCQPGQKCIIINGIASCQSNPCALCPPGTTCQVVSDHVECISDPCAQCTSDEFCIIENGEVKCISKDNPCGKCSASERCVVVDGQIECQPLNPCACSDSQQCVVDSQGKGNCIDPKGKPYWYWIVIGVLLLLVIILFILYLVK